METHGGNLMVGRMGLRHRFGGSCKTGDGRHEAGSSLEGFCGIRRARGAVKVCAERQYEATGNTVGCEVALKELMSLKMGFVC